jgi:coproporphyrinogen III oxidase
MVYNADMAVNGLQAEPRTKVLKNGAVYDLDKKRIVSGALLTSDKARELVETRVAQKRARLMAGANAVIAKGGDFDGVGMDFVEAIGEAVTLAALDPTSTQQVRAAEFLFREAGIAERLQQEAGGVSAVVHTIDPAVMSLLAQIAQAQDGNAFDNSNYHNHVIEAEASDIQDTDTG